MTSIPLPQYGGDERQYVKGIDDDGSLVFEQVGVEELDYSGRFGVKVRSDSPNDISIGDKTFVINEVAPVRVGDDVIIVNLDDPNQYMWGEVINMVNFEDDDGNTAIESIRVYVDDISDFVEEGQANWEIQVVARPKPGIEKDTSLSEVDPTEDGPFTFEVTADKFFPIGGQLLIKPTVDRTIALLGKVSAYDSTTLTVNKTATNAVTPTSYDSWSIALLDAPILYSNAYVEGLQIRRGDAAFSYIVDPGSIMDSTGEVLLTLPDDLFYMSLNEQWGVPVFGPVVGSVVQVPLSGTIGSSGTTVTGSGTSFLSTFPTATTLPMDGYGIYNRNIVEQRRASIYSGNVGRLISSSNNNTNLTLTESWTLSAGSSYGRNATITNLPEGEVAVYFIYIIRNPTTGDVNISANMQTDNGEPDLPSGYTQWRLIGSIECSHSISLFDFDKFRLLQPRHAENVNATPANFLDAKLLSVLGNSKNSTGGADWITATADNYVLRRSGSELGFGQLDLNSLEMQPAYTLLGNNTSSTNLVDAFTIESLTEKVSPADTDYILISDTASSDALKKVEIGNLPSGGGGGDDDSYATALERLADIAGAAQFTYGDGITWFADSFNTTTFINTASSTNEDVSTAGEVKNTTIAGSNIFTGGSNIGDMTSDGGLAAAFNGTTNAAGTSCARKLSATTAYVGRTLASPSSVSTCTVYGSNNAGFVGAINPNVQLQLYGKTGSAPASDTDGTVIGTVSFTDTANESGGRAITMTDTTTVWDHVWVRIVNSGAANSLAIAEIVALGPATANNLDLRSTDITVSSSSVSTVTIWALIQHISGSITYDTNLELRASRTGTETFTEGNIIDVMETVDGYLWVKSEIDQTGQSDGNIVTLQLKTNTTSPVIALKGWVAKIE
jgi:hypothetical protein